MFNGDKQDPDIGFYQKKEGDKDKDYFKGKEEDGPILTYDMKAANTRQFNIADKELFELM